MTDADTYTQIRIYQTCMYRSWQESDRYLDSNVVNGRKDSKGIPQGLGRK